MAIPSIVSQAKTFGAYADATVETILGTQMSRVDRLTAVTLDHMIFLNRREHFEAVPLPAEAQLAPASYAGVADFNGDGLEDLFLSQNFFPTSIGTPRYDTGRGLQIGYNGHQRRWARYH